MLRKLFKFVGGITVGAAVGAVVGILMAPKSGAELQNVLQEHWQQAVNSGQEAAASRRSELETQFAQEKRFKSAGL